MDIEIVKDRIFKSHGDLVVIDELSYMGFKEKALFIDCEYGSWNALVYAVCRGQRHPERFLNSRRISLLEAKTRLEEKHGKTISIKDETWHGSSKKCIFIDAEFGEFNSCLRNVLHGLGHPERIKLKRSTSQRLSIEKVKLRLKEKHGDTITLAGPYVNMGTLCIFCDIEFGEFTALPLNVLRGTGHIKRAVKRREQTFMKKFGVPHHMQNDEQFKKQLKTRSTHYYEQHWKTGEILSCVGTWEASVIKWFGRNQIDFIWQPRAFKTPDGKTYRPDVYIIDMNLWVEIKGWFNETSRAKCEWFKAIMPNFEIWERSKLQELKII